MDKGERESIESEARAHHDKRDFDAAATVALRGYGGEILGFLVAMHRDESVASDAFSAFAEGLWRNLPDFEWRSSLRTWAYSIARNSGRTARRDAERRNRRDQLVGDSALGKVTAAVRTATLEFLRTETRSRVVALRDALEPDDRALLVLRVDRGLSWNELASVLSESEAPLDEADLRREAARLRKRFQVVKEQLREMARREGLRD